MSDDYDAVTNRLRALNLNNALGDRVKVFFIPTYLNGGDGIFDMSYYDLLVGMDLTIFPSYYEPWGYTPLESLAFKVPTTTTSLAGFGLLVQEHYPGDKSRKSIDIITRNDSNYDSVVNDVVNRIREIAALSPEEKQSYKENAKEVSEIALWENNIQYYKKAFSAAIAKVVAAKGEFLGTVDDKPQSYNKLAANEPSWTSVLVNREMPESLNHLDTLARNLWWCWNQDAIDLFSSLDETLWKKCKGNPLALLDKIDLKRYKELEKDSAFMERLDRVYGDFCAYMKGKKDRKGPKIAYFCMEYGLIPRSRYTPAVWVFWQATTSKRPVICRSI